MSKAIASFALGDRVQPTSGPYRRKDFIVVGTKGDRIQVESDNLKLSFPPKLLKLAPLRKEKTSGRPKTITVTGVEVADDAISGRPLRVLDLFSGIGVFGLASRNLGLQTAAFCEIDPFRQKVLQKNFPGVPIYPDITQLKAVDLPPVDCVFGGFPCTDLSTANTKGTGLQGDRSGLWHEMLRIITETKPKYAIIENVPPTGNGDRNWINEAQPALKDLGYATARLNLSAAMFGGCHNRARTFLVAYSDQKRRSSLSQSINPSLNQRISSRVFTKENPGDNGEISWRLPNGEILRRSDGPAAWMERYFQQDKPSLNDRKRIAACGDAIYLPCAEYAIKYCLGSRA